MRRLLRTRRWRFTWWTTAASKNCELSRDAFQERICPSTAALTMSEKLARRMSSVAGAADGACSVSAWALTRAASHMALAVLTSASPSPPGCSAVLLGCSSAASVLLGCCSAWRAAHGKFRSFRLEVPRRRKPTLDVEGSPVLTNRASGAATAPPFSLEDCLPGPSTV